MPSIDDRILFHGSLTTSVPEKESRPVLKEKTSLLWGRFGIRHCFLSCRLSFLGELFHHISQNGAGDFSRIGFKQIPAQSDRLEEIIAAYMNQLNL